MLNRLAAALCAALIALFALGSLIQIVRAESGIASIYGNENGQWRRADGHRFIPSQISCAHKTRRLGSVVRVTVIGTGRSIMCPVSDRGPYIRGRIIDLSTGAAHALGVSGLARVRLD
jgi:rare lipoprotein A